MFYNKFADLNLATKVKEKKNVTTQMNSTWQTEIDAFLHYQI